jgi:hypothetical protein
MPKDEDDSGEDEMSETVYLADENGYRSGVPDEQI